MQSLAKQFREFWRRRSLPARDGVSSKSLADFERKNQVTLPAEMRELFGLMDGTEGASADDLTLWPIQEMKRVPEVFTGADYSCLNPHSPQFLPSAEDYFVFADYLIYSFCYAILLTENKPQGEVIFIEGENWYRCGNSFSEFMENYMREATEPNFCGFLPELTTAK